jgi:hypothetical protein
MATLVDPRTSSGAALVPGRLYTAFTARALDQDSLNWPEGYIHKIVAPSVAVHMFTEQAEHIYIFEVARPWDTWDAYAWFVFHQGGTADNRLFVGIMDAEDEREMWTDIDGGKSVLDAVKSIPGSAHAIIKGAADALKAAASIVQQTGQAAVKVADYLPWVVGGLAVAGVLVLAYELSRS